MKKDKEALQRELEKEAPLLHRMKEGPDGFSVPEGYFEKLRQEVLQKARHTPEAPVRKLPFTRYFLAAAASVAILVAAAFFLFQQEQVPAETDGFIALSQDEMQQYIAQNIDEFDIDLLMPYATASVPREGWLDSTNPDDPEMQQVLDELLDDIDLETLEEIL